MMRSTQPSALSLFRTCCRFLAVAFVLCAGSSFSFASQPNSDNVLFNAPLQLQANDEVLLVSTRAAGTICDRQTMLRKLECHRLVLNSYSVPTWESVSWQHAFTTQDAIPTIVYVHGNRVEPGRDRREGLQVYQSFRAHRGTTGPVRFVIWSWPSTQIRGPIKDYLVKAERTNPVAWQLAWWLDQLPVNTPISLFGYSYGTRVVSGAAHLLAGGRLGMLSLQQRSHPNRPPVRALLLAAAYDADWIQPKHWYSRSLKQIDHLVVATNELDPAMRFFHLSNGRGRMDALGKSGVYQPATLGADASHVQRIDFTREVGRSHTLGDYLAVHGKMDLAWRQLLQPPTSHLVTATTR